MKVITVTAQVEIPHVPSFLVMTDGRTIPVSAIEESGLREIGKAWTEALIDNAKRQRSEKQNGK